MSRRELDAATIIEVLNRHDVEYVIIGGFGCELHQVQLPPTRDIDVCPRPGADNLGRLSRALDELGARIRTEAVGGGLPFAHDPASLARAAMWNLVCAAGEVDITMEPEGGGFDHLAPRAVTISFAGQAVPVAALEDIVASKTAAGRPKDLATLPALRRHLLRRRP